jgi:hypothetical protein
VGFGFPARKLTGRKNRKALKEIAFLGRYGEAVDLKRMGP